MRTAAFKESCLREGTAGESDWWNVYSIVFSQPCIPLVIGAWINLWNNPGWRTRTSISTLVKTTAECTCASGSNTTSFVDFFSRAVVPRISKCCLKYSDNWNIQWGEDQLPHGYHHPREELDQVRRLKFYAGFFVHCVWEKEHHSEYFQPNYLQGSETFSTTMWSGWKRPSRPKRAPRTSETSKVFIRFSTGLAR